MIPTPYLAERMGGGGPGREGRRRRHARLLPLVRRGRARHAAARSSRCAGVVPMNGIGGDQTLTPDYPGISDAADITSWDPPFPGRSQARPQEGRRLLGSIPRRAEGDHLARRRRSGSGARDTARCRRCGCPAARRSIAQAIDPVAAAASPRATSAPMRISAAQGTTDFGEYFLYFSFFLVVSALLLAYLFFAVGLEQRTHRSRRARRDGLLRRRRSARVFIREGAILAAIGAVDRRDRRRSATAR